VVGVSGESEAHFPQQASAVPTVAVEFIAKQVKVAPEQFEQYQWRGAHY